MCWSWSTGLRNGCRALSWKLPAALTASLFGFVAFFAVLALGLPALGIAGAFGGAVAAALTGQVLALALTGRLEQNITS